MGLFGLFVSMVGLGAMAKDAISDSIHENMNYEDAKRRGDPYYFSNGGRIKSTQTGDYVYRRNDNITGEQWLVDAKTGKKITNLTDINRRKANRRASTEAIINDKIFYRVHDYDIYNNGQNVARAEVYKCLTMDGYFKRMEHCIPGEYCVYYVKGELGDDPVRTYTKSINSKHVTVPIKGVITTRDSEKYFEDGTPYTEDELKRRNLEKERKRAKRLGKCFYRVEYPDRFRHVETDIPYVYNKEERSYCQAQILERSYEVRVPHHEKTVTKKEIYWKILPDEEKLNEDGTRWIP